MDSLTEEIRALELSHLQPEVRRSAGRLDALLADDFREVGSSGRVFTKADVLAVLPAESGEAVYEMADFEAVRLAEGVVLATYVVTKTVDAGIARSLRSSIWRRSGGRWRLLFHQGTRAAG